MRIQHHAKELPGDVARDVDDDCSAYLVEVSERVDLDVDGVVDFDVDLCLDLDDRVVDALLLLSPMVPPVGRICRFNSHRNH